MRFHASHAPVRPLSATVLYSLGAGAVHDEVPHDPAEFRQRVQKPHRWPPSAMWFARLAKLPSIDDSGYPTHPSRCAHCGRKAPCGLQRRGTGVPGVHAPVLVWRCAVSQVQQTPMTRVPSCWQSSDLARVCRQGAIHGVPTRCRRFRGGVASPRTLATSPPTRFV